MQISTANGERGRRKHLWITYPENPMGMRLSGVAIFFQKLNRNIKIQPLDTPLSLGYILRSIQSIV